ncbi:unnamed protein product [Durusdinium trenchii]|uniref:Pentatricopeptide repeat-containing protein, chloroplastic n=1 Tax=Durusdinium trenchii TaxID=1381693 RepID=A0ABP0P8U7_9DINO
MAGTTCRLARLKRLTAVIAGLGKSSRWRDALRVGRRSGDTVLHNATMQAATEGRQWEEALAIFQRQRRADRADRVSAGCVVHALARGQHLKRAIHFAKEDGPPGPPWAALIAVCSSASEWQEALAGWAHVDVEDESSLARVMSACTKGLRWDVALCLWQEGGELVPAPAASAALAAASGRLWRLVLQIYGKMQLQSKMSTVQHNLLLGALSKEALWQEAQELLNELSEASQSVRPDVVTYNSVIAACERAWKWTTALHLFTVMRKERLKVSSISCNSLLSAFEKGTQWTKALALLQQMGRWRLQTQVSLCAVASACEKSWQWRRALLHLVGAPDAVSYSVSINACEKGLAWQLAMVFLMASRRQELADRPGFGAALGALEKASQWQHAISILKEMRSRLGDAERGFAGAGPWRGVPLGSCWPSVLEVFSEIGGLGPMAPMAVSSAIAALSSSSRWELASSLWRPDVDAAAVLDACYKAGHWRLAIDSFWPTSTLGLLAAAKACEARAPWKEATAARRPLEKALFLALRDWDEVDAPMPGRRCSVMILASAEIFQEGPPSILMLSRAHLPLLSRLKLMRTAETHEERAGQHVFFARRQIS